MKKKEQQIVSEKPEPFFAYGSQEDVTETEIENRKIRMERAEQIGECFTKVTEEEFEKDRLSKEKI